ncbi:MAG: hypothetical protein ACLQBK_27420 [Candidatus Sulfotelmatobacter sp.]
MLAILATDCSHKDGRVVPHINSNQKVYVQHCITSIKSIREVSLMKFRARSLVVLLALVALPAFADDQEKAQKEIKKVTTIASDPNTRSIVNTTMSEMLNVKRLDLVKDRQDLNLNYGGIFLALQLTAGGTKMEDLASQLKGGKSIFDIANDQHANWKQINSEAKKLNKKIDDNLAKWFQNAKKQTERDQADNYVVQQDRVAADSDASKEELAEAQRRYQQVHDMVSSRLPTGDANVQGNMPITPPAAAAKH